MQRSEGDASTWDWRFLLPIALIVALFGLVLRYTWPWIAGLWGDVLPEPVKVGIVSLLTALAIKAFERANQKSPMPAAILQRRNELYQAILDELTGLVDGKAIRQALARHNVHLALLGGPATLSLLDQGADGKDVALDEAKLVMAFRSDLGMELVGEGAQSLGRWLRLSTADDPPDSTQNGSEAIQSQVSVVATSVSTSEPGPGEQAGL